LTLFCILQCKILLLHFDSVKRFRVPKKIAQPLLCLLPQLYSRRSRFLKCNNRYEELICGSNSKIFLIHSFLKIFSRFLRKCKKRLYRDQKVTICAGKIFFMNWAHMGLKKSSFCVDFKNVNLPLWQKAPKKSYDEKTVLYFTQGG
jgi:hypothetical protein